MSEFVLSGVWHIGVNPLVCIEIQKVVSLFVVFHANETFVFSLLKTELSYKNLTFTTFRFLTVILGVSIKPLTIWILTSTVILIN